MKVHADISLVYFLNLQSGAICKWAIYCLGRHTLLTLASETSGDFSLVYFLNLPSGAICKWAIYCWGRHTLLTLASETSGDFDKLCNSFIQVHIQGAEWCEDLPLPPTHIHMHALIHARTHTRTHTWAFTHAHKHLCWCGFFFDKMIWYTKTSLVARPLFSFPSLSVHTIYKKQNAVWEQGYTNSS